VVADIAVFLCLVLDQEQSDAIFTYQNVISNGLTYLMHAKLTGRFRLTLDSAIAQSELWSRLVAQQSLRKVLDWTIP